ncbi:MAG: reactive intermediate/imine deaminase [Thermoplasmata archaeon HGW-Thermoplasmata-2]|nr:MAG: reactive intermediate/imine deaminase [Thermoplasmata archaeon HGW-Thermoplasmata-2]
MKEAVKTENAPAAIGPYSQAVKANGFIFVSGQLPINPATGQLAAGTIEEQTEQALRNVQAILEAAGAGMENIVKTTIFLRDMNDFARVNETYAQFFKGCPPARSTVQVARLPKDAAIEIEMTAEL